MGWKLLGLSPGARTGRVRTTVTVSLVAAAGLGVGVGRAPLRHDSLILSSANRKPEPAALVSNQPVCFNIGARLPSSALGLRIAARKL